MTSSEESNRDTLDKATMARLREGDDLALNDLIERWKQPLVSFLYRYTSNWSVAVDLAQETFVRVYQSRSRYRPSHAFSAWLFAIAVNLARNEARWRRRHPGSAMACQNDEENDSQDSLQNLTCPKDGPDDSADRSDRVRLVSEAISHLPHDLRTALILFEFEHLSYQQIGGIVGCSAKTIEMRLYRARKQLRKSLSKLLPSHLT